MNQMSPQTSLIAPALFHTSDKVRATSLSGSERRLVVCFTGIGQTRTGAQPEEFVAVNHMEGRNHVLFIADRLRSWYNAPGLFEEIVDVVMSYKRAHRIETVATMGEAMGGYGAILFAGALNAHSALALSAPYSADPKVVPEDDRWMKHRRKIRHFTRPPMETTLSDDCSYFAVHGGGALEKPHWSRFPRAANFNHYLAGDRDDGLSRSMETAGKIRGITHSAILARPVAFRRALREAFKTLRQVEKS